MKVFGRIIAVLMVVVALVGVGASAYSSMAGLPGHSTAACAATCIGGSHGGQVANLRATLTTSPMLHAGAVRVLARLDLEQDGRRLLVRGRSWPVDYITLHQAFLD